MWMRNHSSYNRIEVLVGGAMAKAAGHGCRDYEIWDADFFFVCEEGDTGVHHSSDVGKKAPGTSGAQSQR